MGATYHALWEGVQTRAWIMFLIATIVLMLWIWIFRREMFESFAELFFLPWYRFKLVGPGIGHFPTYGPVLVVANHANGLLDPLLVVIHHNLGGMYLDEDRLAGAREHYTRALALCKEILGAHHPLAAHPLAGIGDVDARQAAFAAAQLRYSEALALMVASYGPDHLYLLHPLAGLGRVHAARGEPAEARRSYERAVAIADLHHANHPLLAEALAGLAALATAAGEPERARVLSGRADRVRAALPAG